MWDIVELSRLQFALTVMYHFIFVPLTLGLAFLLAIMETIYVVSGKEIYKDMVKFWGKLFGINFALGVATGLTMEFQFGTNWSYYSHYVGDVFGAPLAIEALIAFFLESTFIGMFFFGWDRLTKRKHLLVTWLVAIGSNLSALWILVANGWMHAPVGSEFNYETMRMEMTGFSELVFNIVAQHKFCHTIAAGYVTGAMFVAGISSYYILNGRDMPFAKRSFAVGSVFGLCAVIMLIFFGDEAGHDMTSSQPTKLAAIEGEWETHPAPASFVLVGFPDQKEMRNHYTIEIPYLMGILTTRSLDTQVMGIKEIMKVNEQRIRKGMIAFENLEKLKTGDKSPVTRHLFEKYKNDLGHGLLLQRFVSKDNLTIPEAKDFHIQEAVKHSIPEVFPLYWSFRVMVGLGFTMLIGFSMSVWVTIRNRIGQSRWLHRLMLISIPFPWIASECGWFVAEYGRQPWAIQNILPTYIAHSSLDARDVLFTLFLLCGLYTIFMAIEMYLMFKFARLGPRITKTKRPHAARIKAAN